MGKSYQEKLKDPRWQKKRLEILERDDFSCQICFDCESTLHVHHRAYFSGKDPWDIDNDFLVTLCEDCHTSEQDQIKTEIDEICLELRKNFFSSDINNIKIAIHKCKIRGPSDYISDIICHWFSNESLCDVMQKIYIEHLKEKKNGKKTD